MQRNVRFGSKADMCIAIAHVRFTPNSDRESGLRQPVMSALTPKADMCGALADVGYGAKADIAPFTFRHHAQAKSRRLHAVMLDHGSGSAACEGINQCFCRFGLPSAGMNTSRINCYFLDIRRQGANIGDARGTD